MNNRAYILYPTCMGSSQLWRPLLQPWRIPAAMHMLPGACVPYHWFTCVKRRSLEKMPWFRTYIVRREFQSWTPTSLASQVQRLNHSTTALELAIALQKNLAFSNIWNISLKILKPVNMKYRTVKIILIHFPVSCTHFLSLLFSIISSPLPSFLSISLSLSLTLIIEYRLLYNTYPCHVFLS